jgi:hypothetical protein
MKRIILAVIFALAVTSINSVAAQTDQTVIAGAQRGYYIKDGEVYYVHILPENDKKLHAERLYIPEQQNHKETIFTPDQVSEWGLEYGLGRHISIRLETAEGDKWYFMEELQKVDDDTSILLFAGIDTREDIYLLLDEGQVTTLTTADQPRPMWEFFSTFNSRTADWIKSYKLPEKLKPETVRRYFNAFVQCNEKMFPKNRVGVTLSYGTGKPKVYDNRFGNVDWDNVPVDAIVITYMEPGFRSNTSLSVGAFLRIPFEEVLSFQPEVRFFRQTSRGETSYLGDVRFATNSIRLPMMFRFTNNYSKRNLMPYAELGPVFDFNSGAYWYSVYDDRKRTLSNFAAGVALGGGAEYYIDASREVSLGVRFNYVSNLKKDRDYTLKTFELVAGFSFLSF